MHQRQGIAWTDGDDLTGPAQARAAQQSRRCPAGHGLLRRPAAPWCHATALRIPRPLRCHIEAHTCPSTGWSPPEACRARGSHRPDTRRRCVCCPTSYRRTTRYAVRGRGPRPPSQRCARPWEDLRAGKGRIAAARRRGSSWPWRECPCGSPGLPGCWRCSCSSFQWIEPRHR